MDRVIAFVDGFNVYHSLDGVCDEYKWLNYSALANAFIAKSKERLRKIYYFSALAKWNPDKVSRHQNYIRALEFSGVDIVLGKFKKVTKRCRALCKREYSTFEEKETDVNIAIYLLKLAMLDEYDKAIIFSCDSDLVPAVKAVRQVAPQKHIQVIISYNRSAEDLKNTVIPRRGSKGNTWPGASSQIRW